MPFRARSPAKPKLKPPPRKAPASKGKNRATEVDDSAIVELEDDVIDDEEDFDMDEDAIAAQIPKEWSRKKQVNATEKSDDPIMLCLKELTQLRDSVAIQDDQPKDFINDEALQLLATQMPTKVGDFAKLLEEFGVDDDIISDHTSDFVRITKKWARAGQSAAAAPAPVVAKSKTPAAIKKTTTTTTTATKSFKPRSPQEVLKSYANGGKSGASKGIKAMPISRVSR